MAPEAPAEAQSPRFPHTFHRGSKSPWRRWDRDQLIQQRNEASDWPLPATAGVREGPRARGRRGEMTQRRGSLKAPAPCAADGAGAFRELPLLRALRTGPDGRARARGLCRQGARRTRAARGVWRGGRDSWTKRLTSRRGDGRRQRRVRPSACSASAASAQLFPRGVPLLRRAPGPRRGGDPRPEKHPGGGQPVHQVRRGSAAGRGGAALPRSRRRAGRVPGAPGPHPPQPPRSNPVTARRGVSPGGCPAGPPGQPLSFGHPRAIPVPPVDPRPPGVDPGARAAALPSSLLRCPPPGARPGRRAPEAPGRRSGPPRDPHPRAGRGLARARPAEPG